MEKLKVASQLGTGLTASLILCVAVLGLSGCSESSNEGKSGGQGSSNTTGSSPPESSAPKKSPTPPGGSKEPATPVADSRSAEEIAESGRAVWMGNCIACHNIDPAEDGALGPAAAGSSYELLEARVLRSEYPEGYAPKRDTRVMVALPHLEPKLKDLAAYLGSL